jgi:hypothetical protein
LLTEQVGATRRTDQQTAPAEQRHGLAFDEDQIGGVLGGVARRMDRPDGEGSVAEFFMMEGRGVVERHTRRGGQHQLGAGRAGCLATPRDIVVVQVRLEDEPHVEVDVARGGQEPFDIALRIDQHADTVVVEQIGGVTQPGRANTNDLHGFLISPTSGRRITYHVLRITTHLATLS